MAKKLALLIGNDRYDDRNLGHLLAPKQDVDALKGVLQSPEYGFEVEQLYNPSLNDARKKIFDLFDDRDPDDTLLFYFSGHGVLGGGRTRQLFLALQQTDYDRPGLDSLSAGDIKQQMESSYATRQIVILDCCHSGAFQGAKGGEEALNEQSFGVSGIGKALLASSTRLQQARDGEQGEPSLFTHHLVEGLTGEAANDEGVVTLEKLYRYVYRKVTQERGDMTPVKWIGDQEGEFEIARLRPKAKLPEKLLEALKSEQLFIRRGAVVELAEYLKRDDLLLAKQAEEILRQQMEVERDNRIRGDLEAALPHASSQSEQSEIAGTISAPTPVSKPWLKIVAGVGFVALLSAVGFVASQSDTDEIPLVDEGESSRATQPVVVASTEIKAESSPDTLASDDEEADSEASAASNSLPEPVVEIFQDTLKDGSKAPQMVKIPAGEFQMGCVSGKGCDDDELPMHKVIFSKPFLLSRTEVTVGQFRQFVEAKKHQTEAEKGRGCKVWDGEEWVYDRNKNWSSPGFEQSDLHPVVCVSWNDAMAYTKWLSEVSGKGYRLPSEAEWEYAARAGSNTRYHYGGRRTDLCHYANGATKSIKAIGRKYFNEYCDDPYLYTAPVGSFKANRFGLYDMHGNVWEWTEDCWHSSYKDVPNDGRAWFDGAGAECGRRVVRGGSWVSDAGLLRSAFRYWFSTDGTGNILGFRLARGLF